MKQLKPIFLGLLLAVSFACSKDDPSTAPKAPVIGEAIAGNELAKIAFTIPANNGGSEITSYTATSMPGNIRGVLEQIEKDTIVVTGLANDTEYTFTVTATNAIGTSEASEASNAVTPTSYKPDWYYNCYPVYDYWGYYLYDDCYWEYY